MPSWAGPTIASPCNRRIPSWPWQRSTRKSNCRVRGPTHAAGGGPARDAGRGGAGSPAWSLAATGDTAGARRDDRRRTTCRSGRAVAFGLREGARAGELRVRARVRRGSADGRGRRHPTGGDRTGLGRAEALAPAAKPRRRWSASPPAATRCAGPAGGARRGATLAHNRYKVPLVVNAAARAIVEAGANA